MVGENFGRDSTYVAMHSPRPLVHLLIAVTLRLPHGDELTHCRQLAFSLRERSAPLDKVEEFV